MINPDQILIKIVTKDGYHLKHYSVLMPDGTRRLVVNAYNAHGQYIGPESVAIALVEQFGIVPEYAEPKDDEQCTIGFNKKDQRWYGWGMGSIAGFGIGDMLFDPQWAVENNHINVRILPWKMGWIQIETLEEAKQAAIRYAKWAQGKNVTN